MLAQSNSPRLLTPSNSQAPTYPSADPPEMTAELASNPGFSALPNELVMNIIECIPIENAGDIRNLSLTSRRLYRLSLRHMYNHILVSCPWPLVRTLLHDPKLAARVQHLTWNLKTPDESSGENRRMLARMMIAFQPAEFKVAFRPRLRDTWRDHQYMAFFITVTLAIETLTIKDTYDWQDNIYWFRHAVEEPGTLRHLRSVHINGPLCLEQIAHLFLVPSLRNVTVVDLVERDRVDRDYVEWIEDRPLGTVLQPGVSFVENITLKRAFVEIHTLVYFTTACKQLKSFAYEHDVHNDFRPRRPPNPLSQYEHLARALKSNRKSLERLSVRGDNSMMYQRHVLEVARLAWYVPNLRSLDMGLVTHDDDPIYSTSEFVNKFVEYLPPNLEELTFEIDWQEHWGTIGWEGPTEMLSHLAEAAPSALPLLKRVAVVDWPPKLGYFPPDFAMLYKCFASQNVHFASIPVNIQGPDPLRISEFVEPGWIFVDTDDVELQTEDPSFDGIRIL